MSYKGYDRGTPQSDKYMTALIMRNQMNALDDRMENIVFARDYTSFADALSDIGTSDNVTLVTSTPLELTSDTTVPSNIHVLALKGTLFYGPYTLTINGSFSAGLYQVFSGDGNVSFGDGAVDKVYPQWWGASPSASESANTSAFNSAFENRNVFIPSGEYNLNALNDIDHPINITGEGWDTILNFDTTLAAIKIVTPSETHAQGVDIANLRFKSHTNTPASFINNNGMTNVKLTRITIFDTTATAGIVNTSGYGLSLHQCRWGSFTGTALKLLCADLPTFSYSVNLYSCDFSNITGTAIEQEGGDLKIFGGVIESSAADGMVKLATNRWSTSVLFDGVYFEGTNSCFVLNPSTTDYWAMSVSLIGCNIAGSGNWFDLGAKGSWGVHNLGVGGSGITFKATGNIKAELPRLIIDQIPSANIKLDSTVEPYTSIIGIRERVFGELYLEKQYWIEEFDNDAHGVQLEAGTRKDFWTTAGTNYTAVNVTHYQGSFLRVDTSGADNDSVTILGLPNIGLSYNPIVEFRFSVNDISNIYAVVGLSSTAYANKDTHADDVFVVGIDSDNGHGFGAAHVVAISNDNAGGVVYSDCTTVMVNYTFIKIRFDLTDSEQPRVWINDIEVDASDITGTVYSGAKWMSPYIMVQSLSAASDTMYVDYIKIWQDRH